MTILLDSWESRRKITQLRVTGENNQKARPNSLKVNLKCITTTRGNTTTRKESMMNRNVIDKNWVKISSHDCENERGIAFLVP